MLIRFLIRFSKVKVLLFRQFLYRLDLILIVSQHHLRLSTHLTPPFSFLLLFAFCSFLEILLVMANRLFCWNSFHSCSWIYATSSLSTACLCFSSCAHSSEEGLLCCKWAHQPLSLILLGLGWLLILYFCLMLFRSHPAFPKTSI